MSYVLAVLCGLAAAALHLHLLQASVESALASEVGVARMLWSVPLRLLSTSALLVAPVLWCGGAGALLALGAFALASHVLRWRALQADAPAAEQA